MLSFNSKGVFADNKIKEHPVTKFADHIDYLKGINGINNIGIGTDLQAFGRYVPSELCRSNTFPELWAELAKRNYSNSEIEKIFSKNFIEFMK